MLTSALATLGFGSVIALSLFIPLGFALDRAPIGSAESAGIADYFLYLHVAFWPVLLCSLIASVVTALILYRRMTEPLVRFVRAYGAVERGEPPADITIRRSDYLGAEADALNRMLGSLRARSRERNDALADILGAVDELATAGTDASVVERVREAVKRAGGIAAR